MNRNNLACRFLLVHALVLASAGWPALGADEPADVVLVGGKVLTVNPTFATAQAVAIRDGRFVRVGTDAEVRKLVGEKTRVIDAKGRTVIPGLIETHVHATGAARGELAQPFVHLGSIAEMQAWIRERARTTPPDEWIRLPRADVTRIREHRLPTRAELDAAAPERPVVFNWQYAARQVQVLSTAALRAAGITRDTPDPKGGRIVKGPDGEPTGVLEDPGSLTSRFLRPRPTDNDAYLDSLERLIHEYNRIGITSIGERNSNVEGVRAYQKLQQQGRLNVRVNVTIGLRSDGTVEGTEKVIRALPIKFGEGDDWVRVGPLKIAVDGGVLYGTAYLREPYGQRAASFYGLADPNTHGLLNYTPEKVKNMIRTGHRLGWQMCSHVTGDGGVDVVLDAVEAANADSPIKDRRYTLIHAYLPTPEAVRRARELGVCVDTQPAWYYKDGDALLEPLGTEWMSRFIGVADWLRGGVNVTLNSDHMQGIDPNTSLNPYNPFLTLGTAVTRKTEGGQVIGPEQKVSREDALRMMTINAAFQGFDEARKGSIEVGKLGDLAILSDDYLTCDPDRIKDIRVVATIVGGKVVHSDDR
jgi:predicted amidohydrolase YtcJ